MNNPNIDPYAKLKLAVKTGKIVQYCSIGRWLNPTDLCKEWSWCRPVELYRIKPEEPAPVVKEQPIDPNHLGKNASEGYKHTTKNKCLALATGYFYQGNGAGSWYWLFKHESGL